MPDPSIGNPLLAAIDESKLLICVGSGGVGKTTTSAALALRACLRGRDVLVLTIDPARRLLQALGLDHANIPANTPVEVLPRMIEALGEPLPEGVHLHAMMLDPELGASQTIERLLPDPALRDEVLGNRIYRALLPIFSAAPDYVALELIADLHAEQGYDLIVLDTPPTHNAMDFLNAGKMLSNFINERVLRWFARVPQADAEGRRFAFLRRGSSVAMAVLGKLFGSDVLPDIAAFFQSFRDVLPALVARSEQTDALMRSPVTRFIAVTAPGETSLREASHLRNLMDEQGLPFAGFIVNRVVQAPDSLLDSAKVSAAAEQLRGQLVANGHSDADAEGLVQRLQVGAERLTYMDRADRDHVESLRALSGPGTFCAVAPQLEHDIHVLAELNDLGRRLVEGVLPETPHQPN